MASTTETVKPLFVPLRRCWFEQFRDGSKRIEWRAYGARWNRAVATPGRRVVLSLGYSGARLAGTILATRRVAADDGPEEAREIYPDATHFLAIHIVLDSDGIARKSRAATESDMIGPQ